MLKRRVFQPLSSPYFLLERPLERLDWQPDEQCMPSIGEAYRCYELSFPERKASSVGQLTNAVDASCVGAGLRLHLLNLGR